MEEIIKIRVVRADEIEAIARICSYNDVCAYHKGGRRKYMESMITSSAAGR